MTPDRPLRRRDTHVVLRVLLPTVTSFSWYLAYSWLTISTEELHNSVALRTLNAVPSLTLWGAAIGTGALAMTMALLCHSKPMYIYSVAIVLAVHILQALTYAVAAATGPTSSSAWAWPAFVAVVCGACIRGLTTRESL